MPERLPYDEAMLLSAARLKIQDAELRQGRVEKITLQTQVGNVERPWGVEGGFAVVYKFRTKSGALKALRCFRVPMSPDVQYRYERIGPYFSTYARDITVGFRYHNQGILVKESGSGKQHSGVYPVIDMDWVEGTTLVEKVDELCKERAHAALKALSEQWLELIKKLREAQMAHGDLAGLNVMVRGNGQLVLIDYDGVYIPEFAGLSQILVGQVDYQHPQMAKRQFNQYMDDFSALVIYTALVVLSVRPDLWIKYVKRPAGKMLEVNLLFTQQDFKEPRSSALIRELEQVGSQYIQNVVQELKRQCLQPIDQVRFPFHLVEPDYEQQKTLKNLEEAVKAQDDTGIVQFWGSGLEQYEPAQCYLQRVQLAQQRVRALATFRKAQQGGQTIQQIIASYNSILDSCANVTKDERDMLSLAHRFTQAYQEGDDDALVKVVEQMQNMPSSITIQLSSHEQQHIALVRQHQSALLRLQQALKDRSIEFIAATFTLARKVLKDLPKQEQQQIEMAYTFIQAYNSNSDNEIVNAYDAICKNGYDNFFKFSSQHFKRINLATRRLDAMAKLLIALSSKSLLNVAAAYDPVLETSQTILPAEREQIEYAVAFSRAYEANNDEALMSAYNAIQNSMYCTFFVFTVYEQQQISSAERRLIALDIFRKALNEKSIEKIISSYDTILDECINVTQEERRQLALAYQLQKACNTGDENALYEIWEESQMQPIFILTDEEQQCLELANQRHQAFVTFLKALENRPRDAEGLLAAYDTTLLDNSRLVTAEQRVRIDAAHKFLKMYQLTKLALDKNNEEEVCRNYNEALDNEFSKFTEEEHKHIKKTIEISQQRAKEMLIVNQDKMEINALIDNKQYNQAIKRGKEIVLRTKKGVNSDLKFLLSKATKHFIKQYDLTDLYVEIEEDVIAGCNYARASWHWPDNGLIRDGLLVWRTNTWPQHPQRERSWQDPGWHHEPLYRQGDRGEGRKRFSIDRSTHIYIRVYARMRDDWDWNESQEIWRYSDGWGNSQYEAGSQWVSWKTYG